MTDKQKQLLLAFLGYDTGGIDGIWGPMSRRATEAFQKDYMETADGLFGPATEQRIREVISGGEPVKKQDFWGDIRFFCREEFRCTCGGRGCTGFPAEPAERLVRNAEAVRRHFGVPALVSSGVRCQLRNAELPGSAANSLHLRGKAMDFRVEGIDADTLCTYVKTLPDVDEAYAIDGSFVHMGVLKYEGGA
ncbi:MAG: peptidoglycan-binding protein [Oscillospiraceae bacterium]|nr:peptidoglycan-binding protein [Oscillospiraceae bacterium]MBQ7130800.1 peptidoglycan-binding protein [Oscillospiraceae bacterium]